jgi:hypothetical protein
MGNCGLPREHDSARAARTPVLLVAVLVAADVAIDLIGFATGHAGGLSDADSATGIFGWVATVVLAAAAGLAVVLARRRRVLLLLAVSLVFVLVSARTYLRVHFGAWPAVYVPVLAAIAVLLLVATPAGTAARRLALSALVLLAVSLALHELGPPLLRRLGWVPGDFVYELKIALKGSLELGGWALAALALASTAAAERAVRAGPSRRRAAGVAATQPPPRPSRRALRAAAGSAAAGRGAGCAVARARRTRPASR